MRSPRVTHPGPVSSPLAYAAGRLYLTLAGWDVEGELPDTKKWVMIAAPHTSNWDLPFMVAVAWVFRIRLSWLGKHTLFTGPKGAFMRWLGGIPVDRRAAHGVVAQIVDRFASEEAMFLGISPEGTRSTVANWKSGFYHMALQAKVPIVCGFLDFERKVGGVGPTFVPTGDIVADMDRLRDFYEGIKGLRQGRSAEIRLNEEGPRSEPRSVADAAAPEALASDPVPA